MKNIKKYIQSLISFGKNNNGYILYKDILNSLETLDDLSHEDFESCLAHVLEELSEAGINVISSYASMDYETDEIKSYSSLIFKKEEVEREELNDNDHEATDEEDVSFNREELDDILLHNKRFNAQINNNSVKSYMFEMGKAPLLTKEEEIEFAKTIQKCQEELNVYIAHYHQVAKLIIESYDHLKAIALVQIAEFLENNPKHPPILVHDVIKFNRICYSYAAEDGIYYKIKMSQSLNFAEDEDILSESKNVNVPYIDSEKIYRVFESLNDLYNTYLKDKKKNIRPIADIISRFHFSTRQSQLFTQYFDHLNLEIKAIERQLKHVIVTKACMTMDWLISHLYRQKFTLKFLSNTTIPTEYFEEILQLQKQIHAIEKETSLTITKIKQDGAVISQIINKSKNAKEIMIRSNLRLVISFAKKHVRKNIKLQFLDLVQEGNTGLMRAVDKFDYRLGYKFSTYACWWIRQSITRSMADQGKLIRVPVHIMETLNKYNRILNSNSNDTESLEDQQNMLAKLGITEKKIRNIMNISRDPISTDTKIGDDDNVNISEIIEDKKFISPMKAAIHSNLKESIIQVLSTLPPREEEVLKMRFGINTDIDHTLEEVGKKFNVTRERIRQIEAKALKKLRRSAQLSLLEEFMK